MVHGAERCGIDSLAKRAKACEAREGMRGPSASVWPPVARERVFFCFTKPPLGASRVTPRARPSSRSMDISRLRFIYVFVSVDISVRNV
jgi:hypothetical protein